MKLGKTLPFAIAALVIGLLLGATILTPGAVDAQETTDPDEKASSAERWAEILAPLVEDGTITEDQAQAVAEHLAVTIPGRHGRFVGRLPGLMLYAEAAELIGIEPMELRQALSDGSTLAQVAEDNGLDTESLIIVSTPQDIALIDARRAIAMFQKVSIPILGLIENMSNFCCPTCNHITPIFGHGGARTEAEGRGIPFLGEIPLDMQIRQTSDDGRPIVAIEPDGVHARHYIRIAREIWASVASGAASRPPPRIVIE